MRYLLLLLSGAMVIWFSCRKVNDDIGDVNSGSIGGRLFLNDDLTGNYNYGQLPYLTNKLIFLSYSVTGSSPDSNYLFSTKTDSNGYFIFNYLKENTSYQLHFKDTGSNKLVYQADTVISQPGNDSVPFVARPSATNNNGFWLYFTDPGNNGPIDTVSICVFTNPTLVSDTTCANSTYQLQSDSYGRAYLFNINPGTYYLLIRKYLPGHEFKDQETIVVTNTIVKRTIFVQ